MTTLRSRFWTCYVCTFCNNGRLFPLECEMCSASRRNTSTEANNTSHDSYQLKNQETKVTTAHKDNDKVEVSEVSTTRASNRLMLNKNNHSCPICTFINKSTNDVCEMCFASLKYSSKSSKVISCPSSSSSDAVTSNSSRPGPNVSLDEIYNVVEENIELFVQSVVLPNGKSAFKCKLDNRIMSTRALMIAYISKRYHRDLIDLMDNDEPATTNPIESDAESQSNSINNMQIKKYSTMSNNGQATKHDENETYDQEYAMKLALKEYSDSLPRDSRLSSSSSTRNHRLTHKQGGSHSAQVRTRQSSTSKKTPKIEEMILTSLKEAKTGNRMNGLNFNEESYSDEEEIADEHRLQQLLKKMDAIVNNVHKIMNQVSGNAMKKQQIRNEGYGWIDIDCKSDVSNAYQIEANDPKGIVRDDILRDYQIRGVEWMISLHTNGLNGILADEMGLGKTIQVLSFLCTLFQRTGIWGPHLIVMPLSVISSWQADIQRYFPSMISCYTHYGEKNVRFDSIRDWKDKLASLATCNQRRPFRFGPNSRQRVSIVLTSYDLAIRDHCSFLHVSKYKGSSATWQYLVIDEAHRIKNRESVLFRDLQSLPSSNRLLLTGTPLQNNLHELWSLLGFLLPIVYKQIQRLSDWFEQPFADTDIVMDEGPVDEDAVDITIIDNDMDGKIDESSISELLGNNESKYKSNATLPFKSNKRKSKLSQQERQVIIASLHRILKPFLLRRLKSDVLVDIIPKIEKIVYCPLTPLQIEVDRLIQSCLESQSIQRNHIGGIDLSRDVVSLLTKRLNVNNVIMQLRKLCNHPYLILEDCKSIPDDIYDRYVIEASGKMTVFHELMSFLLDKESSEKHKILVFSQFTSMLDILQGYFQIHHGLDAARLDGKLSRVDKFEQIKRFQDSSDESCRVFLLSTRAGGVGLNLQAADTIILFDSDWNPQQDLQAMSRAHRLGQTKQVLVLRLVTTGKFHPNPRESNRDEEKLGSTVQSTSDEAVNEEFWFKYCDMTFNKDRIPWTIEERMIRRSLTKLRNEKEIIADGQFIMGTLESSSVKSNLDDLASCNHNDVSDATAGTSKEDEVTVSDYSVDGKAESGVAIGAPLPLAGIMNIDLLTQKVFRYNPLSKCVIERLCDRSLHWSSVSPSQCNDLESASLSTKSFPGTLTTKCILDWSPWSLFRSLTSTTTLSDMTNRAETEEFKTLNESSQSRKNYDFLNIGELDSRLSNRQLRRLTDILSTDCTAEEQEELTREFGRPKRKRRPVSSSVSNPKKKRNKELNETEDNIGLSDIDETDICQMCKKAWLNKHDVRKLNKYFHFYEEAAPSINLEKDEQCSREIRPGVFESDTAEQKKLEKLRETLLICEGCEGSFHLLCVGKTKVPDDDWYCAWCS